MYTETDPKRLKNVETRYAKEKTLLESLGFQYIGSYSEGQPFGIVQMPLVFLTMLSRKESLSWISPLGFRCTDPVFIHPEKSVIAYVFGMGIVMYTSFEDGWIQCTANFGGSALNVDDSERKFRKTRVSFAIPETFRFHCQCVGLLLQEGKVPNTTLTMDGYFSINSIENDAMTASPVLSEAQVASGGQWFYWIGALSIINSIFFALHSNVSFIFGLGITQILSSALTSLNASFHWIAFFINLVIAGFFIMLGFFSVQKVKEAFWLGIFLYLVDTLILILVLNSDGWLTLLIRFYILYCLGNGLRNLYKMDSAEQK